jgi:hypothetical protein
MLPGVRHCSSKSLPPQAPQRGEALMLRGSNVLRPPQVTQQRPSRLHSIGLQFSRCASA